jgi:hypothetical protein
VGKAIVSCRQVININPEFADAWNNLRAAYARTGNRTAELEAVQKLRSHDSAKAEVL